MSNISKLRDAADLLFELGNYEDAYNVYDEIYCQIWGALGTVQNGLSEFSFGFLTHNIRPSIEFRNQFLEPAVNTIFIKWFNLDIDQTLNEFIFTIYGHLQCICYSRSLISQFSSHTILCEFLILYNLIYHSADEKWITYLLRYVSPVIDNNRLKKIRINLPEDAINKQILQLAEKLRFTDWSSLNQFTLEYVVKTGDDNSELFRSLKNISGAASNHSRKSGRQQQSRAKNEQNSRQNKNEKQGKSEKQYKSESQEKHKTDSRKQDFDPTAASEDEKIKHYGSLLGLKGKVTKSDIRKRYLEEISKYHPDKVQNLGEEIIEFAERRTKEINAAYDWLKIKFNL